MKGEFKAVLWARIIGLILLPLPIGFLYIVIFGDFSEQDTGFMLFMRFGLMPLVGLGFGFLILAGWKSKVIIDDEKITQIEIYGTRVVYAHQIKGYRVDDKYLRIIPKDPKQKKVLINIYTQKYRQIREWIAANFTDLDIIEAIDEQEAILADQSLGTTVEERSEKLEAARKAAKYFNIAGVAVGLWAIFFPRPYLIIVSVALIMPLVAVMAMARYRGLMSFDQKKNSAYPSIVLAFMLPGVGLTLRALVDYELIYSNNVWYYTIGGAIALAFGIHEVGCAAKLTGSNPVWHVISLILFSMTYCFGAFIAINCAYDSSDPKVYQSTVADKEISSGKTTTYYLILDAWGPFKEPEKAKVTRTEFESVAVGDSVITVLKPGLLKTQWYYVVTD